MGASVNTHCLMVSKMDGMLTAAPRLPQTVFTSERIAKNSMHTWHIEPCVFFCYVVFSCNNFNNEVFYTLAALFIQKRRIFAAKIRRKRRVTKFI